MPFFLTGSTTGSGVGSSISNSLTFILENTDDNGELEEPIEDNPAAYLAEVAEYTAKTDPTIKENIEWHISSPKSGESEEWFKEELSRQYSNTVLIIAI
ncbi:8603_t:CDS:2, partial [Funneliformis caledonium]